MALADYYLCAVCGTKAIYDGSDDARGDVIVIHGPCYSQILLSRIVPLEPCFVCEQHLCAPDCPNRVADPTAGARP